MVVVGDEPGDCPLDRRTPSAVFVLPGWSAAARRGGGRQGVLGVDVEGAPGLEAMQRSRSERAHASALNWGLAVAVGAGAAEGDVRPAG